MIAVSGNESHSLFLIKLTQEVINNMQRSVKLHYNCVFPLMATWVGRTRFPSPVLFFFTHISK